MNETLVWAVFLTGLAQLCVLVASCLVPFQLEWRSTLAPLPKLVRQMFWVYGFYVVLSIISLGLICMINAREIAGGSWLAKSFCIYVAVFWGIRLGLQTVFDAKPYLTKPYLRVGYHLLTVLFLGIVSVMIWCVIAS